MSPSPVVIWLVEDELPAASPEKLAEFLAVVKALRRVSPQPAARPRRRAWLRWPGRAARHYSESALHGAASEFTEVWRHLLASLPDSYACYMTCGEAETAADLYRAAGDEAMAAEIIAAHARYDEPGALHYTAPAPAADPTADEAVGQAPGAVPGGPMPDEDVLAALAALWADSGWQRLEVSRQDDQARYGGYCMRSADVEVRTADLVARDGVIGRRLAALLDASGWRRLEVVGHPGWGEAGGWCERADGSGLSWTTRPGGSPAAGDDVPRPAEKDPWL